MDLHNLYPLRAQIARRAGDDPLAACRALGAHIRFGRLEEAWAVVICTDEIYVVIKDDLHPRLLHRLCAAVMMQLQINPMPHLAVIYSEAGRLKVAELVDEPKTNRSEFLGWAEKGGM